MREVVQGELSENLVCGVSKCAVRVAMEVRVSANGSSLTGSDAVRSACRRVERVHRSMFGVSRNRREKKSPARNLTCNDYASSV